MCYTKAAHLLVKSISSGSHLPPHPLLNHSTPPTGFMMISGQAASCPHTFLSFWCAGLHSCFLTAHGTRLSLSVHTARTETQACSCCACFTPSFYPRPQRELVLFVIWLRYMLRTQTQTFLLLHLSLLFSWWWGNSHTTEQVKSPFWMVRRCSFVFFNSIAMRQIRIRPFLNKSINQKLHTKMLNKMWIRWSILLFVLLMFTEGVSGVRMGLVMACFVFAACLFDSLLIVFSCMRLGFGVFVWLPF